MCLFKKIYYEWVSIYQSIRELCFQFLIKGVDFFVFVILVNKSFVLRGKKYIVKIMILLNNVNFRLLLCGIQEKKNRYVGF